ncbi:MAG: hypothetical protein E7Y34_02945, partial [Mycoplasma sp.]|nr:hypothetical protein [Mycoplasma sp.]
MTHSELPDETEIFTHKLQIKKSLSTLWYEFINKVSINGQLRGLDLIGLTDEDKWLKVKERIENYLIEKFETIFGDNNNLKILLRANGNDLDLETSIPKLYLEKNKTFDIVLTHSELPDKFEILTHKLQIKKSLSTLWYEFINKVS